MFFGEEMFAGEGRGGVARIHRAIAIAELRPLARGAAVGVGLADHDRLAHDVAAPDHDRPHAVFHDLLERDDLTGDVGLAGVDANGDPSRTLQPMLPLVPGDQRQREGDREADRLCLG